MLYRVKICIFGYCLFIKTMVRNNGIKIETDLKGVPKTVTIDLVKNKKVAKILQEMGILEIPKQPTTKSLTEFTKDCYTKEEAIKESFELVKKWNWKVDMK